MRPLLTVTLVASVVCLAACGSENRVATRKAARLQPAVAASLAHRSDALAAALRRDDGCAARIQMHGLERQTRLAIAAGRIPAVYRPKLLAAVSRLASRMPNCVPPAPPPTPTPPPPPAHPQTKPPKPPKHDHGKHGQRGKHGGKDH